MRRRLRSLLPDHEAIRANRWLAPFENTLLHPRLWHLNRRSAAGAVAIGLFCGLIPGPLQMAGAVLCVLLFRVNLPLALATTLYTNPLTIVPLYVLAFGLGNWLLGSPATQFVAPPDYADQGLFVWGEALIQWMQGLGTPLALGLLGLASLLALCGYLAIRIGWRIWLVRAWRVRQQRCHRA
jgi:uncharacterized protein (DUF2062 family)